MVTLASIIAERAAAALKESRKQRRQMDIGTPTWTGRSGVAGAPLQFLNNKNSNSSTPSPRFGNKNTNAFSTNSAPGSPSSLFGSGIVSGFKGSNSNSSSPKPSSGSLLAKMRERKAMLETDNSSGSNVSINILDNTAREGMIVKMRDYLSQHNGRGTSQDIMNNLDLNINQEQIVMFRKMLQAIARFEKDSITGKGLWILKEDFF